MTTIAQKVEMTQGLPKRERDRAMRLLAHRSEERAFAEPKTRPIRTPFRTLERRRLTQNEVALFARRPHRRGNP